MLHLVLTDLSVVTNLGTQVVLISPFIALFSSSLRVGKDVTFKGSEPGWDEAEECGGIFFRPGGHQLWHEAALIWTSVLPLFSCTCLAE